MVVTTSMAYRPDIDGLRSIAVSAVIIYHLKLYAFGHAVFPGGFLGVDVFFVLSGYLITRILLLELESTQRIDLARFYLRRARRILPALLLVTLASVPVAWLILLPSELQRFSDSLLAAVFFYGNYFWFHTVSEYGAQSGLLQPFLHTWSLAIEEQFYLVFPVLLVGIWAPRLRRWTGYALFALVVAGLIIAQVSTAEHKAFSFFATTSRAWELLCGAWLAYCSLHATGAWRELPGVRLLPPLALACLLASFAGLHLERMQHPGWTTVPVVAATCVLIWFATPDAPVTRWLSRAVPVRIGKLSYSLYLWHFPIFAFGRHLSLETPDTLQKAAWLIATFALSWAGYRFIEKPFRFSLPLPKFAGAILTTIALVPIFAWLVSYNEGFGERFAMRHAGYGGNQADNEVLRMESWEPLASIGGYEVAEGTEYADKPSDAELKVEWYTQPSTRKVLIVGNSHSKDMFNAAYLNSELFDDLEFARFAMQDDFPDDQIEQLLAAPNFLAADAIAIAPRYSNITVIRLPNFIDRLRGSGKQLYVVGNTAEFRSPGARPLFDWFVLRNQANRPLTDVNVLAYSHEADNPRARDKDIARISENAGVLFLSRRNLLCSDEARLCWLATPGGRKTLYDYGHWTQEGAAYFGALAAREGWFAEY